MKPFAESFYKSKTWQNCRRDYIKSVGGLCENCLKKGIYKPAIIVHHIEHITPSNIENPEITLNFSNLKAVCRDCHAALHSNQKQYKINQETGEVIVYDRGNNNSSCI